ncbi:hypothetical protein IFM89_012540 [Coptis chinensis]|uniref:Uncharacterized protein n=1 Tax=Coptis chinensis TaxID=261450 RepID=A0A835HKV7_9MAGN|nr:hypothetical protein IFM89_012540 [Coptis chinensis]
MYMGMTVFEPMFCLCSQHCHSIPDTDTDVKFAGNCMKGKLNNLMIQLRKKCSHPDLLESAFDGSWKVAAANAQGLGIGMGNPKLQFAQLKGLVDELLFGLRNVRFQVSKYFPYGSVEMYKVFSTRLLSTGILDVRSAAQDLGAHTKVFFAIYLMVKYSIAFEMSKSTMPDHSRNYQAEVWTGGSHNFDNLLLRLMQWSPDFNPELRLA